uniref:probable E3 ubiquitin-protein ligase ZFP1 n=1 Tax=Erigeron canadensis TaxID=72917 RepID=UPI001CB900E9|nr:probable E3 ubiquitin-protein ligase ZFP1 [Erigeron canadensis]XP_043613728.1 probable E3 ubiquitin-protein ligase ZFP1 [Erigeron canadensis]XP_043613729.1 probable E3 ubiquitin-protein ligase ZFP1 [Erigeron canadensis]
MGHRHISNQCMISGFDQHVNNLSPAGQSYIPTLRAVAANNGPCVAPVDHTFRGGVHSNSVWDLVGRSHERHSSYVRMEVQSHLPHSSTNANTPLAPMNPVAHNHSTHYDVPRIGDTTTDNRVSYKRKSHAISGSSSSSYYGAESSYRSQMLIEKPAGDCHSLPSNGRSSLSVDGQDVMRNVRRRRGSELESCMPRTYVPSYGSHYYQPATHSTSYSVPVNLSADVVSQEWNPVPHAATSHGRNPHPDINGPRHEASHFHPGGSSVGIEAYYHSSFRRNLVSSSQHCSSQHPHVSSSQYPHVSSLQYPHVPSLQHPHIFSSPHPCVPSSEYCHVSSSQHPHFSHSQFTGDGHSYHPPLHTNGPSYCNHTHIGSSSTNAPQLSLESLSCGYPSYSGRDSGYRSTRSRIVADRLQPIVSVHHGLGYETLTVDQSSFYQNPRVFLDQYQGMRLDIDDMSYEELLALEESIGIVNTGLSEDGMSKCLREQVYYSAYQNHDDSACPICLEEYKNGEKVGRMEKCVHRYHVDCIKKWLLLKKVCPICKTEC